MSIRDFAVVCVMKKIMRRLLRVMAWTLPFLFLFGLWAVEQILPYWPIKPFRQNPEQSSWRIPRGPNPESYGLRAEAFEVRTPDSILLQGFYISAPKTTIPVAYSTVKPAKIPKAISKTIIILHGISSCKEFFLPVAEKLVGEGINVVLLDLRAHGQSGGEYCTFGYYEKQDISAVVDMLLQRDATQKIGVMGHSLGGAIALQVLAYDKRLQFGVIESTFTSLESVVEQYGVNYFGIRSPWLARHTLDKSAVIARFDPYAVVPVESARQITQPVFVSHGDSDERIPWQLGRQNFEQVGSPDKQWYLIPNAGHNGIWKAGGAAYESALMAFLKRQ
jgi:uncharacterized protein